MKVFFHSDKAQKYIRVKSLCTFDDYGVFWRETFVGIDLQQINLRSDFFSRLSETNVHKSDEMSRLL